MMSDENEQLAMLVATVLDSARYGQISRDLVASVGQQSLRRHRSLQEAIKETKRTLHQVAGAFATERPPYAMWLDELSHAAQHGAHDAEAPRRVCARVMRAHVSTRERLPMLERFYAQFFAGLPPVRSVLDVACGLNPLSIPWMGLPPGGTYYALDIYQDMISFLDASLPLLGAAGWAQVADVAHQPVEQSADLALVLKALPTLEQIRKGAGMDLLRGLRAPVMLVSFSARSLGGRDKGMARAHEQRFTAAAAAEGWALERYSFPTELVFRVRK